MFSLLSFGTYNYHIIFVIKYIYKKELGAGEVRMLVKDVAGLLFWFGLVWFGSFWFGAVRTTSSFSPRHPKHSGRRRHFHHVIPNSPDDVAIFTTSSQAVRTTSSFSPRHPRRYGRRRRFHHVIPNSPDDVVVFTTSSQRLRTTSPFSQGHRKQSGRRRHFDHVIP